MAQMDPAATKTVIPMTDFSDFSVSSGPMQSAPSRVSESSDSRPFGAPCSPSAEKLIAALTLAADKTATSIAHGTKQTRLEVRERLNEVIRWVVTILRDGDDRANDSPVIAR